MDGPITLERAINAVVGRRGSDGPDVDLAYPLWGHLAAHVDRVTEERTADGVLARRRS